MKKRFLNLGLLFVLGCTLVGCGQELITYEEEPAKQQAEYVNKADFEYVFRDKDTLYENDNDTDVITMYLTVSKGNASENTNHTWAEVNAYSAYYYEDLGIEKYGVNGLLQVGDENGPLPGKLGYGQYAPNATVTIRGQTSTKHVQKNYKITINEKAGTINNQKIINLNKHEGDGIRFKNKMAYDLMKQIPEMMSLRTQFVHLYVRDLTEGESDEFVDYGLYTQVEQPNKRFLESHGLDKNGHLYKINLFEFYRYEDEIMLKSDANYDKEAFERRIEIKGNDDHSKLIALLEDVNDISVNGRALLNKWFDEENVATWMAFHILIGNLDTQSRNTLLYSPLNVNKFYLISWDNDGSFVTNQHRFAGRDDVGWEHGISNYWGNMLYRKLLQDDGFRNTVNQKVEELYQMMSKDHISKMVTDYKNVVKDYVYASPDMYHARYTEEEYDYLCSLIPSEIEENYQKFKNSLEEPMPFYIGIPEKTDKGISFVWDTSYDFANENIFYSFELADNLQFTNPVARDANLIIPEFIYNGELEPGQYFVRVRAKNSSGYSQPAFDYYYSDHIKYYGVVSFYVMQDGVIEVQSNEDE